MFSGVIEARLRAKDASRIQKKACCWYDTREPLPFHDERLGVR